MPLYEYECKRCHHRFERIQKFSDPLARKCPKCKVGRLEKLISAPAVQFKGTGWYITDYGSKKGGDKSGEGKSGEGGKSESGGKDSEKSGKESEKSASSDSSSGKGKDSGKAGSGKSGGGKSSKS